MRRRRWLIAAPGGSRAAESSDAPLTSSALTGLGAVAVTASSASSAATRYGRETMGTRHRHTVGTRNKSGTVSHRTANGGRSGTVVPLLSTDRLRGGETHASDSYPSCRGLSLGCTRARGVCVRCGCCRCGCQQRGRSRKKTETETVPTCTDAEKVFSGGSRAGITGRGQSDCRPATVESRVKRWQQCIRVQP